MQLDRTADLLQSEFNRSGIGGKAGSFRFCLEKVREGRKKNASKNTHWKEPGSIDRVREIGTKTLTTGS
jgi:hypothetical protein